MRVRVAGDQGVLTIKGMSVGASPAEFEFEYPMPLADAQAMLLLCDSPVVQKMRHVVMHEGMAWEVDAFLGDNAGLVVAEIELASEDQAFALPDWVGREVTGDARYFNSSLASHPFSAWGPGG